MSIFKYGPIAYQKILGKNQGSLGLLFCTGLNSNMQGTKALKVEEYAEKNGLSCVRFDYRGHGDSDGKFVDFGLGDWMQDGLDVLDNICDGDQILVGSSIGGWIGTHLAIKRTQKIKGLVLIAPAIDITAAFWNKLPEDVKQNSKQRGVVKIPSQYSQDGFIDMRYENFMDSFNYCLMMNNEEDTPLNLPIYILHGAKDDVVPVQISQQFFKKIQSEQVNFTIVKDGDHRLSRESDLLLLEGALEWMKTTINTQP